MLMSQSPYVEVRTELLEVLSFHNVGIGHHTLVTKLDRKHPYPLKLFAGHVLDLNKLLLKRNNTLNI